MIVDGREIATRIYNEVAYKAKTLNRAPILVAITCAPNFETGKYLTLKRRKAAEVGVELRVVELPEDITTNQVVEVIDEVSQYADGIVVQLPFPKSVNREVVLSAVPVHKDPDGFSYGANPDAVLPPVVGAIAEIAKDNQVLFKDARVVVMGQGRLVGSPAATFLRQAGSLVTTLTEVDKHDLSALKEADVIISGIGQPHFITVDMVKPGVVIFDAGTSEDGGVVVGDLHPDVASIAKLYTPVPGGIGPITVAILLRNLVDLVSQ
jgi:methylenetetrahydrofolate dehydrogenase (NADP+)/methenyltetrahydrofolate cyclohydrolase